MTHLDYQNFEIREKAVDRQLSPTRNNNPHPLGLTSQDIPVKDVSIYDTCNRSARRWRNRCSRIVLDSHPQLMFTITFRMLERMCNIGK